MGAGRSLIAMNLPSLDKYENSVPSGSLVFVDSSLVQRPVSRKDVKAYYIPATALAAEKGYTSLANIILMGYVLAVTDILPQSSIGPAMEKVVSARHAELLEKNLEAIRLGYDYKK